MCTVTYIPQQNNAYLLTHNRDERYSRSIAMQPRRYKLEILSVFYPKDLESGGTWICTSECVFSLCLLNGADEFNGDINKNYPKSRGQIILDFFNYYDIYKMYEAYSFEGYAPFTLIYIKNLEKVTMCKLTWDGHKATLVDLDPNEPQIWSSTTLYTKEDILLRKEKFQEFLLLMPILLKKLF